MRSTTAGAAATVAARAPPWRDAFGRAVTAVLAGLAASVYFVGTHFAPPTVRDPWGTAPDLEPVPAAGHRLLLVLVDGLNADRAFDPEVMPFVAGHRAEGAWGIAETGLITMTGPGVLTIGTGRPPTLSDAIENFEPPPAPCDSVFRRLHLAGKRTHLVGDRVWERRFGAFAERAVALADRGMHDQTESDREALAAALESLRSTPDLLVVHFVGADHAGHADGTVGTTGAYARRLREIDADIRQLALTAAPDTAVLVIADHGMTDSGGHGGGEPGPRRAPFVWWGAGVLPLPAIETAQTAIAPTLAGFFGVPPPGESAGPVLTGALALSPVDRARLERNLERQRAATGADTPEVPTIATWGPRLLGVLLALAGICAGLILPRRRTALAAAVVVGLAAIVTALYLPSLTALILGMSALLAGGWPTAWVDVRHGLDGRWLVALTVAVLLSLLPPVLRWLPGHVEGEAVLLLGLALAGAALARRAAANSAALHLALGAASLAGLAIASEHGLDIRRIPDGAWGIAVLAVIALPTRSVGPPALALAALALAHRLVPPSPARMLLLVGAALLLCWTLKRAARHRAPVHVVIAATLVFASLLATDTQLVVLSALGLLVVGATDLPRRRLGPLRLGGLLALLGLLETVTLLALSREYTFSSIPVAAAFAGGADLDVVSAVILVVLGDVIPLALVALGLSRWDPHAPRLLTALASFLGLRFVVTVLTFPWVAGASFWLAASELPYLAAILTAIFGLLPVLALARLAAYTPSP